MTFKPHHDEELATHHAQPILVEILEAAGPLGYLQVALIAVAFTAQVVWLMRDQATRVNAAALGAQLKKLIDAGNPERAIKLCAAAPNAHATSLARVGLEARMRGENARDAMRAARPRILKEARSGYLAAMALGAMGFIESCVILAKGAEKGFGENFMLAFGMLPLFLSILLIVNGRRRGAVAGELAEIERVVAG